MNIGEIIRRLRKERKMTLLELSTKSGVALATLSRMENGRMTGTLDSHMHIAEALGISFPDMYRNLSLKKKDVELHRKKSLTDVFIHSAKASSEILVSKAINKKMMPVLVKIGKGGVTHKEETRPDVEKFIHILDGKVEAVVGEERYNLTRGDTLYFESSITHYFRNTGTGEVRLIMVISPPTL